MQASIVLGQFLLLDKDEKKFKQWLENNTNRISRRQTDECYQCLRDYCNGII